MPLEIWAYNANNTAYFIIPAKQVGKGCTARCTPASGFDEAFVPLVGGLADYPGLVPHIRIEFVYRDAIGTPHRFYRGYIRRLKQRQVPQGGNIVKFVEMRLFGGWQDVAAQTGVGRFVNAPGEDKAYAVSFLYNTSINGKVPNGTLLQAIPIGDLITNLDTLDQKVSDVMSNLVSDSGDVVYGVDVDPGTSLDRLFFRPDDTTVSFTFNTPGGSAVEWADEDDFSRQRTYLIINGGLLALPNFLSQVTGDNTSFEKPFSSAATQQNYLLNSSFESSSGGFPSVADFWSALPGAAHRAGGNANTGSWQYTFNNAGDGVKQTVGPGTPSPTALVIGDTYTLLCPARMFQGNTPIGTLTLSIEWIDSTSTPIYTDSQSFTVTSSGYDVTTFQMSRTVPPTAYTATITAQMTDQTFGIGGSLGQMLIDDIDFYDASQVSSPGWELAPRGTAVLKFAKWDYSASAYDGIYSLYINGTSSDVDNNDIALRPQKNQRLGVNSGQSLRLQCWVMSAPVTFTGNTSLGSNIVTSVSDTSQCTGTQPIIGAGIAIGATISSVGSGTLTLSSPATATASGVTFTVPSLVPKFQLQMRTYTSDGTFINDETIVDYANGTFLLDWTPMVLTKVTEGNAAAAEIGIVMRSSGSCLIDACIVCDNSAPTNYYVQGTNYREEFNAADIFNPMGSSPNAALYAYALTAGIVKEVQTQSVITNHVDGLLYATGYLSAFVPPLLRPTINIAGCIDCGNGNTNLDIYPGALCQAIGVDAADWLGSPLPVREIEYSWDGFLNQRIYLGTDKEDPARLLEEITLRLIGQGGTGTSSGIAPSNVISGGGGGTGSPPSVMLGATIGTDGASGLAPQPLTGQEDLPLHGDATYKQVQVDGMTSGTASSGSVLTADGIGGQAYLPGGGSTVMVGATAGTDGAQGLAPQPLTGQEDFPLHGDATYKQVQQDGIAPLAVAAYQMDSTGAVAGQVPLADGSGNVDYSDIPVMIGAALPFSDGSAGSVPQPLFTDIGNALLATGLYGDTNNTLDLLKRKIYVAPFTYPLDSAFTQINFVTGVQFTNVPTGGVASIAVFQDISGTAGTYNLRSVVIPGTFTSLRNAIVAFAPFLPGSNASFAGVVLRESSSGKMVTLTIGNRGGSPSIQVYVDQWSSNTANNSSTSVMANYKDFAFSTLVWLWIQDTTGTRNYYVSSNGAHWFKVFSEAHGTYITPDSYGMVLNATPTTETALLWQHAGLT